MSFQRVMNAEDLWSGEMVGIHVQGQKILLLRCEDQVMAWEDRCVHQAVPLSEGSFTGRRLICYAHHWEFDAVTGAGLNPCGVQLVPFPVEERAGGIWVDPSARGCTIAQVRGG